MKIRTNFSFDRDKVIVLCWIAFLTINVVTEYITKSVGGIGVIALNYLFMMYFIMFYGKQNKVKISIAPFLIFLFFYILEYQFVWKAGKTYTSFGVGFNLYVWNMISTFPFIVSAIKIVNKSDREMMWLIRRCLLIVLMVISIASIGILKKHPDASRLNSTASGGDYYPFLAGYGIIYGITILMPYLLCYFSKKSKYRYVFYIGLAIMLLCVFMAAYTIALVCVILGVGCYFFLKIKNHTFKVSVLVLFIIVLSAVFLTDFYKDFLIWLADHITVEKISKRIIDTVNYLDSGTVEDSAGRFLLYGRSLQLIKQHPLIGCFLWDPYAIISAHSTNLDIIGSCGLLVFLIYAKFIHNIYSFQIKRSVSPSQRSAIISAFIVFLFLSTVNAIMLSGQIFAFLILGVLFVDSKESVA